ncbi:4263_t:CDS:2 [Dentiscutata erythropus]|uniref:4263_t:CDS:1 n=1 Tax=Dentiscutata erythropus TaxID=1348616 RepID=A0A9N9NA78_9GLOM|nr:4263_t:CDS:2 [Dentiscutata erythropus]
MDLEAKEIEADEKDKEENTKKKAEQIAVSYGYTIHCSDRTTQKLVINQESENIIKNLMENLQEDLEICEEKLHEARYNKICVFDPETKKYLGALHRKYYGKKLIIQDEEKIESGYDFHYLMQEIAKVTDEKIVPIANNLEQYITFSVGQLQFIDSLKFSLPGLAKMAENLCDEKKGQTKTPEQLAKCFPIMSKFISPHLLLLLTHFNNDLDEVNYCEQGCESKEYYPMCPEQKNVPYDWYSSNQKEWAGKQHSDTEKLILTLHDKNHYVIHYRNLQQCIKEGYVFEKVYQILGFEQSPWLEPYIAINTQRRAKAKNAFEKDFWKLMNNSVFGKTMEDVRKQWKDENGGDRAIGYAGVRAKYYSVVCDCTLEGKENQPRTAQFLQSYKHRMYKIKQTKRSINPLDTKLWIDQDGITTYLYGDCEIPEE